MSNNLPPRIHEESDQEAAEYRSVSRAAVAGLILGILAPLALVDTLAWCVPFAGILLSGYALWKIHQNAAELTGRKAALCGLWLSLCFAVAAPADRLYYRYRVRQEGRQFAAIWFDLLAQGRPEKAFQLAMDAKSRQPLDDKLWDYYRNNITERAALDNYVAPAKEGEKPKPVRTLLALGKSATVRYLDSPQQEQVEDMDIAHLRYAVTFDDAGEKKTFLLIVQLIRRTAENGRAFWKVNNCVSPEDKTEKS